MKELLSNEEIDSLMEMFRSDDSGLELAEVPGFAHEIVGDPMERDAVVSRVDLLQPNRLPREQMSGLERMFENSAKAVGRCMSDRLRYAMHCDCVAVEQLRFGTWLQLVGADVVVYVLEAPPLEAPLLLSVTTNLLHGSVDRILGGQGRIQDAPKDFSEAELAVADAFLEPIVGRLAASMAELLALDIRIAGRFRPAALPHVLLAQDVVLSAHLQTGGDLLLGDLRLVLPYVALAPHLRSFGRGGLAGSRPGGRRAELARAVQTVPIDFTVELGGGELSVGRLLDLRVGDVVPLRRGRGEPLIAPVAGVPKFSGRVGTRGRRLAFQVAGVITGGPLGGASDCRRAASEVAEVERREAGGEGEIDG